MVIAQKTKNQKTFAQIMGWTPSYLSKLVSEQQRMGLTPVVQVLEKFPDIDARWFLFGTGYMFGSIEREVMTRADLLLSIEKFIPVMTEDELQVYLDVVRWKKLPDYSEEDIIRWEGLLLKKNEEKTKILTKAMKESVKKTIKGLV